MDTVAALAGRVTAVGMALLGGCRLPPRRPETAGGETPQIPIPDLARLQDRLEGPEATMHRGEVLPSSPEVLPSYDDGCVSRRTSARRGEDPRTRAGTVRPPRGGATDFSTGGCDNQPV
ncbi:hypothetical protein THAOC_06720 [Thalassiosira oceanica]|uniref:Uncharacterized protein n=1 Tax=Thalassiosira oceanica TaxID=159749 RepID=K0T3W5_THAOC|nr:hypothetical protein THAOC_06720 [Thalassiosira oceanica]|eukprot:EJK71804.1 hypothetical protein THAOC_06720 [Thalassiosira oceanica]